MPPAEPAPDLGSRLLAASATPPRNEGPNEYVAWKKIADELKTAGFPLNLSTNVGVDHFSEEIRKKAADLDRDIESLVMQLQIPEMLDAAILEMRKAICQGLSQQEFKELMDEYNFSVKCNVIWESDAIAYRCNTCSKTPCMSLCADCFKGGDHAGHDVTRFFSREGGACDCGNEDVLKESGFCAKHGEHALRPPTPPDTVVSLAELLMLRVLMVIFGMFRAQKEKAEEGDVVPKSMMRSTSRQYHDDQLCGAAQLVELLQECVSFGGPIRDVFARMLIDEGVYEAVCAPQDDDKDGPRMHPSMREFKEKHVFFESLAKKDVDHPLIGRFFPEYPKEMMRNGCLLHELLFWMRYHIFPQTLVNLTLVFLGDIEYRDTFARRFFLLYPWTAAAMRAACNHTDCSEARVSHACSRIIHVSVQMLSSSALCSRLTDEINLPRLMFGSIAYLLLSDAPVGVDIKPLGREIQATDDDRSTYGVPPRRNNRANERPLQHEEEDSDDDDDEQPAPLAQVEIGDAEIEAARIALAARAEGVRPERQLIAGRNAGRVAIQQMLGFVHADRHAGLLRAEQRRQAQVRRQAHAEYEERILNYLVEEEENSRRAELGEWMVLDDAHNRVIKNHGYMFAMGDSQNLLSHSEVVVKMCRDAITMRLYFSAVEKMQCMDPIQRIVDGDHIMVDRNEEYQRALMVEHEMSSSSMFNIVLGIVARGDEQAAVGYFDECWKSIEKWCAKMDLEHAGKPLQLGKSMVTFHLPLSRHLSTMLAYLHSFPGMKRRILELTQLDASKRKQLMALMLHPLRIQAARAEWGTGMWVRNGQQMRFPVVLYSQTPMVSSYYLPDMDLLRLCAANLDSTEVLHAIFESFSLGDVFKWKLETGSSGVFFKPSESLSLSRMEWVDPMVCAAFRLVLELVLVPGVAEQSDEDQLRDDVVCKLTMMDMPHSKLRQSMSEKGSHGAELVDQYFERILEEVADFSDPEMNDNLEQGIYTLGAEAMIAHVCPLLVMGRSSSQRAAASALQRIEMAERKHAGRPEHQVKNVWIPYRLPDFEKSMAGRPEHVRGVYGLLRNGRLLETACYVLMQFKSDSDELERRLASESPQHEHSHEFIFKEETLQLTIYLLSIALLLRRLEPEGSDCRAKFHFDLSDTENPNRSLARAILAIGPILMAMNMKRGEMSKEEEEAAVGKMMREAVGGEIKARLVAGTPAEYYGRLLAILHRDDAPFRVLFNEAYPAVAAAAAAEEPMDQEESGGSPRADNTPNTFMAKKRAAAEALRKRILEDKKRKGGETMRKLMEEERMTQEDLDRLDVSDQAVEQYECPICSDETPASFDQPIGLLVYLQFNGACLNSMDGLEEEKTLIELDEAAMKEGEEVVTLRQQKHARFWRVKNSEHFEIPLGGTSCEYISTPTLLEMKTCGHHAHLTCMQQYRETTMNRGRQHNRSSFELLYCPKCRFPTNGTLPLRVRTGVEVHVAEQLRASTPAAAVLAVYDTLVAQLDALSRAKDMLGQQQTEEEVPKELAPLKYSSTSIASLIINNTLRTQMGLFTEEDKKEEKSHVVLQALLIQNVERNLFFEAVGVTPERPKCADVVSEHLAFHSSLLLSAEELRQTKAHLKELLAEEPTEFYASSQLETEAHGSEAMCSGDMENGCDPLTLEERTVLFAPSRKMADPPLSADVQAALTPPNMSKEQRWLTFHPPGCSYDSQTRVRYTKAWKQRNGLAVGKDTPIPAILVQPFVLAIRMTSIAMSTELNRESIVESLRVLMRRVLAMATLRCHLMTLCRADGERIREWADEERLQPDGRKEEQGRADARVAHPAEMRRVAARVICCRPQLMGMLQSLQRRELPSFEQICLEPIRQLLMRVAQLWHEIRVLPLPAEFRTARSMTAQQLETHVLGAAGFGTLPSDYVLAQWAMTAAGPLASVLSQNMLFLEEPPFYRPFISLQLPEMYDDLFARYFGRKCRGCGTTPTTPLICLICSDMLCLDRCCIQIAEQEGVATDILEVERHTCGVHIPFLALNAALIVFVKQNIDDIFPECRAQIWGGVYLDAHGEEDRNLRRGKPLKLSQKRVDRMLRDFLEGDVSSRSGYHSISHLAEYLRDSHYR